MTSKKKLVKSALEHPELYAPAELSFFELWMRKRKEKKEAKKREKQESLLSEQPTMIETNQVKTMTVTQNEQGQNNLFAKEPPVYLDPTYTMPHNERAERLNGRVAMISLTLAMISYATTGTLAFGIW